MSLFKLLKLWSFTLNQLEELAGAKETLLSSEDYLANYVVCPGTFKSIGQHVVFVCGSLSGLFCIIQVPDDQQTRTSSAAGTRQLLTAKKLDQPIVDVKCGFFSSTVKQSIAVLSFEDLSIYQVKKNQQNLLDGHSNEHYNLFGDHLFEYCFEEVYKFSLQSNEIATSIEVSPQDTSTSLHTSTELQAHERKDSHNSSSLALPQRDYIVVQYTNQFLFTLINHKKIIAHYEIDYPANSNEPVDNSTLQVQRLSRFLGHQAMVLMRHSMTDYLAMAMSNNHLYMISISKLISLSKENVMKRVVDSLLSTGQGGGQPANEQHSSLAYNNPASTYHLNIDENSDWQLELTSPALQLQSITMDSPSTSRILALSRYFIDVYSNTGEHVWSHRSETPLICMQSYCFNDKLNILLCSDFINDDKCNLLVLEDGMKVWSSLMYQKPSHIWRANLTHVEGAIAILSSQESCLSFGYLGTQSAGSIDQIEDEEASGEQVNFAHLESYADESLLKNDGRENNQTFSRLDLDVALQASNKWPEVRVDTRISIKPDSKSHGILQDVVVVVEYDDLLNFVPDPQAADNSSQINEGATKVELGTHWADGSQPLCLSGTFSLKPVISFNFDHAFPKTLKVKLTIKFTSSNRELLMQFDEFFLPLTMIANLTCIEYSCQHQEDTEFDLMTAPSGVGHKYAFLVVNEYEGKLIEFADKLIESDLICRGFNWESSDSQSRLMKIRSDNYGSTMENLSLLSQSLDCRLRYKSLRSTTPVPRQRSEEYWPLVALRICFEFKKACMFPSLTLDTGDSADYVTVWLHLYDLWPDADNKPVGAMLKRHFKKLEGGDKILELLMNKKEGSLVVWLESAHPLALLLVQQHLLGRLDCSGTNQASGELRSALATGASYLYESGASVALMSAELRRSLKHLEERQDSQVRQQFHRLKLQLDSCFHKFQLSSNAMLAYAKRLPDLPEEAGGHFGVLVAVNRKYQLQLVEVLSKLEQLRLLDRQFAKIPDLSDGDNGGGGGGGEWRAPSFGFLIN